MAQDAERNASIIPVLLTTDEADTFRRRYGRVLRPEDEARQPELLLASPAAQHVAEVLGNLRQLDPTLVVGQYVNTASFGKEHGSGIIVVDTECSDSFVQAVVAETRQEEVA